MVLPFGLFCVIPGSSKKKKRKTEKKKNRLALWTGVKGKPDKDKLTDDTEEESVRKASGLGNT